MAPERRRADCLEAVPAVAPASGTAGEAVATLATLTTLASGTRTAEAVPAPEALAATRGSSRARSLRGGAG